MSDQSECERIRDNTPQRLKLTQRTKLRAKIVLIGDGGVGKTTLCRAWLGEEYRSFKTDYSMTIGADFYTPKLRLYHSSTNSIYDLKIQIWDLIGQPRFKLVRDLYYRGAIGALCFFDITIQESYENLNEWIKAFWKLNGHGKTPVILVGNKCDLRGNPAFPFQIATEKGKTYAAELSALVLPKHGFKVHYIETSAKDNINVDKTFRLLADEIISYCAFQEKIRGNRRTSQKK